MSLPAGVPPDPALLAPLFTPLRLNGALTLRNRIVLAPCTRNRATADLSPTAGAVSHYASRAEAGLMITEATLIARNVQGYLDTPGLFLSTHVEAWSRVTEAVHARGGLIFSQLWHLGRMAHSHFGGEAVGPSAVLDPAERRQVGGAKLVHETPREMSAGDIDAVIAAYAAAAGRAREAGFDGIEIHAANGYLPEQFLRLHTNRRADIWGGSPANRARFALAVVAACAAEIGAGRVGIRLSPAAYFSEMRYTPGDNEALIAVLEGLAPLGLAYVHTGIVEDVVYDYLGTTSAGFLRQHWAGTLIGNGAYSPQAAASHVAKADFDLIAFGKLFLANADLVSRLRNGGPLRPYSREVLDAFT